MNILLLSVGTRVKIVQYFKKAFCGFGKVIAADMSALAPALYEADARYIVPRLGDPGYLEEVLDICRRERVTGILSLIDPELSVLAENEAVFQEAGVMVIGSSKDLCDMALDKMKMHDWLKAHGYPCARSYSDKDAFFADADAGLIGYPVMVKPIRGSASKSVMKAEDRETVDYLFAHEEGLMVQEYLDGTEIGADVYVDMLRGEPVSLFTKKKLLMRVGETDKSVSFKSDALNEFIVRFCRECGWRGQIDMDIFDVCGVYYISEVNPRFGGGYPHAYECGADHMKLIRNNLAGSMNTKNLGAYDEGIYMLKYCEVQICGGDASGSLIKR
ncbi:MAG: ATP-grasp domain-containing protein [Mailhella sp.]|nr:ATP-grasp domain-containing protein [Mailhella sp.]